MHFLKYSTVYETKRAVIISSDLNQHFDVPDAVPICVRVESARAAGGL